MILRWLWVVSLLAACGARTGAEVDRDGGRAPAEAGFDTFTCWWSLAQPTIVHRTADRSIEGRAAIHAVRDEALTLWRADGAFAGARLQLGDPPPVLETLGGEAEPPPGSGEVLGVRLADPDIEWVTEVGCRLYAMGGPAPGWREVVDLSPALDCALEPHHAGRVDLTAIARREVRLWSASDLGDPTVRRVAVEETGFARSVRLEGHGWILLTLEDERWVVHRVTEAGTERAVLEEDWIGEPRLEPDRVRPGVVVFARERPGRWQLVRIPFEGELRPVELVDLSSLGSEPTGPVTTNETEVLFPLSDGRVAVAPLSGADLGYIGPVPTFSDGGLRVVLRPGTSGGGLLYQQVSGDLFHLVFQPLTCNR